MGCRSASLNRWPGTQGNVPVKDLAEIRVEQLGFRDAIVNCVGARRKLVPPSGPRKGLTIEMNFGAGHVSQRVHPWHMGSKGVAKVLHRTPEPMVIGLGVTAGETAP
jgi:hypothetical protein